MHSTQHHAVLRDTLGRCHVRAEPPERQVKEGQLKRLVVFVSVCTLVFVWFALASGGGLAATPSTTFTSDAARAGSPAAPPSSGGQVETAWTYALYVDASNDLAYCWNQFTLPDLEALPANPDVNVVVMIKDRLPRKGVRLLKISGGHVQVVASWRDKDFGSGRTFAWFLRQVHSRFPSQHLAVTAWDHGYAWRGFSWDDRSGHHITMAKLREGLGEAAVPIDVLSFDCCNMADVEAVYDIGLTGMVKYVVASEEEIDQDGIPYDNALEPLLKDASLTPEQVAADTVAAWQRYYRALRCQNWGSLSVIDVGTVMAAKPDLMAWVARLHADLGQFRARYRADLHHSYYAAESWQVDLADVAANLAADAKITDPTLRSLSAAVAADARAAIQNLWSGSYANAFTGMTLWWGTRGEWSFYRKAYAQQVAFGHQIGWLSFLKAYNAGDHSRPHLSGGFPSGWPQPVDHRATYGLQDVVFANTRDGWATGYSNVNDEALIMRTTDGGARWKVSSPAAWGCYTIASLSALDAGHAWAVGSEGWTESTIARTTSGGAHWQLQQGGKPEYLESADFINKHDGWIAGTNGTLLHTTDGGARWNGPSAASNTDYWSVDFAGRQDGWLAGGDESTMQGVVMHTSNGGATWSHETVAGAVLYSVYGLSASQAWAVGGDPAGGNGVILHTSDGGSTWQVQDSGSALPWLGDVTFVNASDGWAVGEHGAVLHTMNGGETWTSVDVGAADDLTAVCFTSALNGWIVGDGEGLLHTRDGGLTWTPVQVPGAKTAATARNVKR